MRKIRLVNMPFSSVRLPSIGLTQLKGVVDQQFGDKIVTEILHFNHDVAQYFGVDFYQKVSNAARHIPIGLGDWIFRHVAFPELPDNLELFFRRNFPGQTPDVLAYKQIIREKRPGLDQLLDQLIETYRLDQADMIGFTSMFSQNVANFAMARKLKERNPAILIVMGGANCESEMGLELIKQIKWLDYVFSGPALKSFPEFISYWLQNDLKQCDGIKGVFSKTNYHFIQSTATMGEELSINEPVELDYQPFMERFEQFFGAANLKPILQFETSRGCWWGERSHCTFCGLNGLTMSYRAMQPEHAVSYINSVLKHAPKCEIFESVDNILPKEYIREVLPYLKVPPGSSIFYEVKADLDEQDLQALAEAGVTRILPGVEALSTQILKLMRKGTSAFQNIRLLKNCLTYDIHPSWNLLIGFPGEKEAVYEKYAHDIPLLIHLPPPNGSFPIRFDRFSPYFEQAEELGLQLEPLDFYKMVYPFDKAALARLAYFFRDTNAKAEYMQIWTKWIGKLYDHLLPWMLRWRTNDTSKLPCLYLKSYGNRNIIFDSRADPEEPLEYDLSPLEARMLQILNKPRKISDLAAELKGISASQVDDELVCLQQRGLLFEETERYLSLVVDRRPVFKNCLKRVNLNEV